MREAILLTCEHGGNRVPRAYGPLFRGHRVLLASHRGWDPGTLELGRFLRRRFGVRLLATTVTRLLVDANRSADSPQVFSAFTRGLPEGVKRQILARYHRPHREAVRDAVAAGRCTLHLALHSFTPVWRGRHRATDVGILHDPARPRERALSLRWQRALQRRCPDLRVHLNRPYRGWTDGLATHLRRRFTDRRYAGIELEVSQRFPLGEPPRWRALRAALAASLDDALSRLSAARRPARAASAAPARSRGRGRGRTTP